MTVSGARISTPANVIAASRVQRSDATATQNLVVGMGGEDQYSFRFGVHVRAEQYTVGGAEARVPRDQAADRRDWVHGGPLSHIALEPIARTTG